MSIALLALVSLLACPSASQLTTTVRPWGDNAIRVQLCAGPCLDTLPGALESTPPPSTTTRSTTTAGTVTSGNLEASTDPTTGMLTFTRVDDTVVLLKQTAVHTPAAATGGNVTFSFASSTTLYVCSCMYARHLLLARGHALVVGLPRLFPRVGKADNPAFGPRVSILVLVYDMVQL